MRTTLDHRLAGWLAGVSLAAGALLLTACGMGSSRAPAGSAGIADSAASAASAPQPAPSSGSAPGAM